MNKWIYLKLFSPDTLSIHHENLLFPQMILRGKFSVFVTILLNADHYWALPHCSHPICDGKSVQIYLTKLLVTFL